MEIRGAAMLPARREDVTLHTHDDLSLVGELAMPLHARPKATLITLHPLPTAGGFMDSHILRKAAARLPALADLAVLRFNTRGTSSDRGTSEGVFGEGETEKWDLQAAMDLVSQRDLPHPWLVGWSFGTEVALKHGSTLPVDGVILLSPPLHRTTDADLDRWHGDTRPLIALIPEFDDYLRPDDAAVRFAGLSQVQLIAVAGGRHLWVGEKQTRRVLREIVAATNPAALPLPTQWDESDAAAQQPR